MRLRRRDREEERRGPSSSQTSAQAAPETAIEPASEAISAPPSTQSGDVQPTTPDSNGGSPLSALPEGFSVVPEEHPPGAPATTVINAAPSKVESDQAEAANERDVVQADAPSGSQPAPVTVSVATIESSDDLQQSDLPVSSTVEGTGVPPASEPESAGLAEGDAGTEHSPPNEPAAAPEPIPIPAVASVAELVKEAAQAAPKHAAKTKAPGTKAPSAKSKPKAKRTSDSSTATPPPPPVADDVALPPRVTKDLPRVIAIANQKGGVGKTTTTVNLGAALAEMDYRVLVIDLDPQGNATTGLGIDARNFELSMYDVIMRDAALEDCIEPTSVKNLFVAPATIDLAGIEIELVPAFSRELKLKRAIDTVVDDFDFILIDCPPSLGLITINGLAAAGEVLVPIQCEYYALEGLSQLLRNVHLVASNLNADLEVSTIVLTMYDARTRLAIDVANEVREHFAEQVCRNVIPRTVRLSEAPSFGQPITVFDPTSRGAVAYRELAKEVSNGAPKRAG
jgi:chromosome partitioning protein